MKTWLLTQNNNKNVYLLCNVYGLVPNYKESTHTKQLNLVAMYGGISFVERAHSKTMRTLSNLFLLTIIAVGLCREEHHHRLHKEISDCSALTWNQYNEAGYCECGAKVYHIVYCTKTEIYGLQVSVLDGFCLTQNTMMTETVVGACSFNFKVAHNNSRYTVYTPLPNKSSALDNFMCGNANRAGQMCGQCRSNTSPPVYSYHLNCVECPNGTNNWGKYLVISLLPTTLLYIGVITFKFRATSPYLNGYLMFAQIATSPIILRRGIVHLNKNRATLITLFSLWNLDFFRGVYDPFCLHPNATTLQVLALDYIVAVYPLVLIILTYCLVRLHYYNFRLVVWLSRPFIRCFSRIRRQWDMQNTLVDAFATFLLLSYIKFASVSLDLLMPSPIWNTNITLQRPVVYYNGTMEYFGRDHLPFAVLAITVLLLFTLFPILLLCLYPCRWFQQLLNRCHLQRQALNTFIDAFQGSFKNGTDGSWDCRYFSAVFLMTRVLAYVLLGVSMIMLSNSGLIALLLSVVLMLCLFQPYTNSIHNTIDIIFFTVFAILISCYWVISDHNSSLRRYVDSYVAWTFSPVPVFFPLFLVLYFIYRRYSLKQTFRTRFISIFKNILARSSSHVTVSEVTQLVEH